ncbi:MAG: uroporphyrinogen decarboxylase family protein [Spirochaetales bacterium]|nr:uroporphyrinogen decarboxylase family protein [Spirochaetales bacterium]
MNGLKRTMQFIEHKEVDRPPFHPILMQWSARYGGVKYRDYCQKAEAKAGAFLKCAADFDLDWVTVMSDPYCEAEAFGLIAEYPEDDLPLEKEIPLKTHDDIDRLTLPDLDGAARFQNLLKTLDIYKREAGDELFITGWVEGPMAEYADLRGISQAFLDLMDCPEKVHKAMDVILENAIEMVRRELAAGAHCIGIGDAAASLVGPDYYEEFIFERERELVQTIQKLGGIAKLHICGDTRAIQQRMIATGVNIIDVDHLNGEMGANTELLSPGQVFCGNSDPVEVILQGRPDEIEASVRDCARLTGGRTITSAGCEIPRDTSIDNFTAYSRAATNRGLFN